MRCLSLYLFGGRRYTHPKCRGDSILSPNKDGDATVGALSRVGFEIAESAASRRVVFLHLSPFISDSPVRLWGHCRLVVLTDVLLLCVGLLVFSFDSLWV